MTAKSTVLAVVVLLGAIAIVALGGAIWLTNSDHNVPDGIWTIAAAAAGALAAVLARTSSDPPEPPPAV
jgi:hypothetical protein